jgi:ubiquinone/menaquinone biosynthesis C-methylase UbiE
VRAPALSNGHNSCMTNTESWDRIATRSVTDPPTETVLYGPEGPTEEELRLIGDVKGKRVVDLGCGLGQAAITMAKQGATVIAVDDSARMLERGRSLADRQEARVEWHRSDISDLAFLRADSIDVVVSIYALAEVEDLGRLLRQVHRVLRGKAAFVFSHEHPLSLAIGREPPESPDPAPIRHVVRESYFATQPISTERDGEPVQIHIRPISETFTELTRAGFRVEAMAEIAGAADAPVPQTIVWRARKEGV